ncbi:hypothetical protein FSP39_006324 [Pinctada imbricata]|uniref:Uncharacterized protein n=1 Tax=Pinctada imbricata TaxID=66713 RepID=A0AA89C2P9_PINIB|nr:hypothetical protein FSP39_006324 [Pinctada imbricata]
MFSKLEIACRILRRSGYDIKTYQNDRNEFFQIVGEDFPGKSKSASSMRKEICEFEEKHRQYFQLFLARNLSRPLTQSEPSENFRDDLNITRKKGTAPTPREVFAAAELLQRSIYIFEFSGTKDRDIDAMTGVVYAPVIRLELPTAANKMTMLIMALDDRNQMIPYFARIIPRNDGDTIIPYPAPVYNADHKNCIQARFRNTFLDMHTFYSMGQEADKKDFFRRLSIEVYGTDQYSNMVKKLICDLEMEDDNLDVFTKFIEGHQEDSALDERKREMREHVEKLRAGTKMLGDGELFAAASIFNVSIFVDKGCADLWELFCPLGDTYAITFDSPIAFKRQTVDRYMPFVTNSRKCACEQGKINVKGKVVVVKEDIYRALAKRPCCPPQTRHGCHRHLKHIGGSKIEYEERNDYHSPGNDVQLVLHRLQAEERTLDQVTGTLYEAFAREVFGDESFDHRQLRDILSRSGDNLEHKIHAATNWLGVPVYVYRSVQSQSQRFLWKCYQPTDDSTQRQNEACRYYVTLFFEGNNFDRIVPREGCNCQLLPPISILRSEQDPRFNASLVAISKGERHSPLVTFLTEDPADSLFEVEEREFPSCAPYSEIRGILTRPDMRQRTIDATMDHSFSLFRCVSKEIFGTEENFDFILKEVCKEIMENVGTYHVLLNPDTMQQQSQFSDFFKSTETIQQSRNREMVKQLVLDIENGIAPGDPQLLALATHFQTTVYVLSVDYDEDLDSRPSSVWTEYTQLRNKRKPPGLAQRRHRSKCPPGKFYIALFRSAAGQYHRIVPDTDVCNCCLIPPTIPDRYREKLDELPVNERVVFVSARKVENALAMVRVAIDEWLRCNRSMQSLCDAIIIELESRRRNVSIATLLGSGAGVGGALVAVGALLLPATGGASTALVVIGGLVGGLGGLGAAGAGIAEFVMNKGTIERLERYQTLMRTRSDRLQEGLADLLLALQNLDQTISAFHVNQNLEAFDMGALRAIPNVLRAIKGFAMIPLGVLRVSIRGLTIAAAILGPLAAVIDAGFILWSIYSLSIGSKTDVSENIRRISAMLRSSRVQMHAWAYGNHIPLMYR